MPWIDVAARDDLARNQWMQVDIDGAAILLFDFAGEVYATGAICARHATWLATGTFDGECGICPSDKMRFRLPDSNSNQDPPCSDLRTYPICISDDRVFVEL